MSGRKRNTSDASVLTAAINITEREGLPNLNIIRLAEELEMRPASLYNHIKGIDEVKANVARYALGEMDKVMRDSAIGRSRGDALLGIANAVRDFAVKRPELYSAVNLFSAVSPDEYKKMLELHSNVIHQILDAYISDRDVRTQFILAFRSGLHGFVSLEVIGAFGDRTDTDEHFRKMIVHLIKLLEGTDDGKGN